MQVMNFKDGVGLKMLFLGNFWNVPSLLSWHACTRTHIHTHTPIVPGRGHWQPSQFLIISDFTDEEPISEEFKDLSMNTPRSFVLSIP